MAWYLVLFWGALGGLLHSIYRNDGLEIPEKRVNGEGVTRLDLGVFADLLLGAAAAYLAHLFLHQGVQLVLNVPAAENSQPVVVNGIAVYLLAGWSGGAFFAKRAIAVEQAKVERLSQEVEALSDAPGVQKTIQALVKARNLPELTYLKGLLPKTAGAVQPDSGSQPPPKP